MNFDIKNNFTVSFQPKSIDEITNKKNKEEYTSIFDSMASERAETLEFFE